MNSLLSFLFSLVRAAPLPPLHPLPLVRSAPERLAGSELALAPVRSVQGREPLVLADLRRWPRCLPAPLEAEQQLEGSQARVGSLEWRRALPDRWVAWRQLALVRLEWEVAS